MTCAALSVLLDVVCTGGQDGTAIISGLRSGQFIRSIAPTALSPTLGLGLGLGQGLGEGQRQGQGPLRAVLISNEGFIVTYAYGAAPASLSSSSSSPSTASTSTTPTPSPSSSGGGGGALAFCAPTPCQARPLAAEG